MSEHERELTPEFQSALSRIKAAAQERQLTIPWTFAGVEVELRFLPSLSIPAMRLVSEVQKISARSNPDMMQQLMKLTEFLDLMADDATGVLIGELLEAGVIDITELAALQQEVVARVARRPTTRSGSSADGSDNESRSSMGTAPTGASTPMPSPSPAS